MCVCVYVKGGEEYVCGERKGREVSSIDSEQANEIVQRHKSVDASQRNSARVIKI